MKLDKFEHLMIISKEDPIFDSLSDSDILIYGTPPEHILYSKTDYEKYYLKYSLGTYEFKYNLLLYDVLKGFKDSGQILLYKGF